MTKTKRRTYFLNELNVLLYYWIKFYKVYRKELDGKKTRLKYRTGTQ